MSFSTSHTKAVQTRNHNLQAATDEDVIESIKTGTRVGNKTYAFSIGAYIKEHFMTKQTYVFIIDEINRGEISKIFGELFYAVDPGYEGKKVVSLPNIRI